LSYMLCPEHKIYDRPMPAQRPEQSNRRAAKAQPANASKAPCKPKHSARWQNQNQNQKPKP
ncbi:hypothetical protein, partial [Paraburkholderia hospita]|uniref:hypothetical protein n=1 Tax=Paraburkholderia hospita TaxID=169430 RepID=UPI001A991460